MDAAHWEKLKDLFTQAIDLPAAERASFLENCDEELRNQIENLIEAHEHAEDFIAEPAMVEIGLADDADANIGRRIDGYELLSEIGQGGMGAVYLAKHTGESFTQTVAVKLIKRGMDTAAVLKRFVMERQILADLEHANIARLLDVGTTDDGLPYFVMEYIEGLPVTKYCDAHGFSVEERLKLFRQICAAVSYAHQNLVVHRDIKPSNILVTKDEKPKLLDFGIAKLLNPDWSVATAEATATIARLLTPEYASPEQLRGANITTASDVYSLGVVLYELLSGQRPFVIETESHEEFIQAILTKEPVRPSAVGSRAKRSAVGSQITNQDDTSITDDSQQNANPKSQILNSKSLKGDLDNIILKALRKEPERRYQSVQEFSEDIRRHLAGLPVTATADTTLYHIGKFIQRHKIGISTATLVSLLLLLTTTIAVWQAVRANEERARAERRFAETRKIANSLLFEIHDSLKDLPGATASREILVNRALEYLNALSQENDNNPELLHELAVAYRKVGEIQSDPYSPNLGQSSAALQSYQRAFEIQENLLKAKPEDVDLQKQIGLTASQIADNCYFSQGSFDEALKYYRRSQTAYEIISIAEPQEAKWKSSMASLYFRSASILFEKNDSAASVEDSRISQKFNDEALAIDSESSLVLLNCAQIYSGIGNNLGNPDYNDLGKPDEALEVLQKALLIRTKLVEREPGSINLQNNLGVSLKDMGDVYLAKGDVAKAIENYRKSLAIHQAIANKDAKDALAQGTVGYDLTKLGNALTANGELKSALEIHEKSFAILEKIHLADLENVMVAHTLVMCLEGFANALKADKNYSKALSIYQRGLQIEEKLFLNSTSPEFEIKIAQIHFKLGQTRQLLYNSNVSNKNLCLEASADFQKSVEKFTKIKNLTALSPTNSAIFSQARQSAESINCQK